MSRQMGNLTLDTLSDLPNRCRQCVFWELAPGCSDGVDGPMCDMGLEKEAWLSATLLDWGSCGCIAYMDGKPAGFVSYAAPRHVPRAIDFPTGPASQDAALLMTAHVSPQYTSNGLGRMLVHTAARDLARRGVTAIETFGDARGEPGACVAPEQFFRAVGFETVKAHPHYPRLRMDLRHLGDVDRGAANIDAEVESWLAAVTPVSAALIQTR